MNTIYIGNLVLSYDEVKNKEIITDSEYDNYTLNFCKAWLNNQEEFTFESSGSTGSPKVIEAPINHMKISAQGTINALQLASTEHFYVCISSKLIGGAMLIARGLMLGCDITIVTPSSNPLKPIASNHPYTLISLAPMQIYNLPYSVEEQEKLGNFKQVLLGGAPANDNCLEILAKLPCIVWQTYGMTETMSHIALRRVGKDSYYRTLDGIKIKVDNRKCLCIESEITNHQWLITNDLVEQISETQFDYLGRLDDVINSGGIKIFTHDVEFAIHQKLNELEIPHRPFFAAPKPDEKFGEAVIVIFLGNAFDEATLNSISAYCKQQLGKYSVPKAFYFLDEFERLDSGKLNKKATVKKLLKKLEGLNPPEKS